MNYHTIKHDDMLNGTGLRVVLFVSGCDHKCEECQNPETWDCNSGKLFDGNAIIDIRNQLDKDYIDGITLTGGDPLFIKNRKDILQLVTMIKYYYPDKTIWLYTGYSFEYIINCDETLNIAKMCDVIVDGKFDKSLADVKYEWAGSTNQRIINIEESLKQNKIILYETK